jgi:WD40 repeat protein
LAVAVILLQCAHGFSQSQKEKLFLVCGDSKVLLVDYNGSHDSIPQIIWSWDAHEAQDLPEPYRSRKFNSIDDCKAEDGGKEILLSSSSGAIAILNRQESKVLFYASVPNAHSVAKIPGNRLVAAASTAKDGNKIIMFDIRHPEIPLFSDSLYSAHGLVWNQRTRSLFALGFDVLREYKLASFHNLKLVNSWKIPGQGGHDLQLSPGGKSLLLTEHNGSWEFDLKAHRFGKISGFRDHPNTKSLGQHDSRQFMVTIPEESWWTFHVTFFNPDRKMVFRGMRVYKARWVR